MAHDDLRTAIQHPRPNDNHHLPHHLPYSGIPLGLCGVSHSEHSKLELRKVQKNVRKPDS